MFYAPVHVCGALSTLYHFRRLSIRQEDTKPIHASHEPFNTSFAVVASYRENELSEATVHLVQSGAEDKIISSSNQNTGDHIVASQKEACHPRRMPDSDDILSANATGRKNDIHPDTRHTECRCAQIHT